MQYDTQSTSVNGEIYHMSCTVPECEREQTLLRNLDARPLKQDSFCVLKTAHYPAYWRPSPGYFL